MVMTIRERERERETNHKLKTRVLSKRELSAQPPSANQTF